VGRRTYGATDNCGRMLAAEAQHGAERKGWQGEQQMGRVNVVSCGSSLPSVCLCAACVCLCVRDCVAALCPLFRSAAFPWFVCRCLWALIRQSMPHRGLNTPTRNLHGD
jgi:hypothetical protein